VTDLAGQCQVGSLREHMQTAPAKTVPCLCLILLFLPRCAISPPCSYLSFTRPPISAIGTKPRALSSSPQQFRRTSSKHSDTRLIITSIVLSGQHAGDFSGNHDLPIAPPLLSAGNSSIIPSVFHPRTNNATILPATLNHCSDNAAAARER